MWTEVTDINSHRLQGLSKSKAFIISVTTTECFGDVVCNSKNPFEWPPCWTTAKSNLGKEDWISIHWECIVMHGRQINWMFACSPCSRLLRSLSDPAVDVTVGDTSGRPPWVWGSLEMRNLKTAETEEFVVCMPEKASVSFSIIQSSISSIICTLNHNLKPSSPWSWWLLDKSLDNHETMPQNHPSPQPNDELPARLKRRSIVPSVPECFITTTM